MEDLLPPKETFTPRKKKNKGGSKLNFYCEFCTRQIHGKDNYDEHNNSAFHKERKKLLQDALLSQKHYCYSCDKIFPTKVELDSHCLLLRHLQLYRVQGVVKSLETSDSTPWKNAPIISSAEIKLSLPLPNISAQKEKAQKTVEESAIKPVKRTDVKVKKGMFYCRICDVDCGYVENFKSHVESWRHRGNVDNLREANVARRYVEEEQEPKVVDKPETVKSIGMTEKGNFYCDVCCIPCTGKANYDDHLNGKRHHRKVSQMKPPFCCYSCNEKYATEREFKEHLASDAHILVTFKGDPAGGKGGFRKEQLKLTGDKDCVPEGSKERRKMSREDRNESNSRSRRRSRNRGRASDERRSRDKEKQSKNKRSHKRRRSNSSYSSSSDSRSSNSGNSGNSRERSMSRRERKDGKRKSDKKSESTKADSNAKTVKVGTSKIERDAFKEPNAMATEGGGIEFGDANRRVEVVSESDGLPKVRDLREKLSAGKGNIVITKLVDRSQESSPKGEAGKEDWTVDTIYNKSELAVLESKDKQPAPTVPLVPGKESRDSSDELSDDAIDQLHRESIAKREKLLDEREAALLRFRNLEEDYKKFQLEWEYLKRRLELHDIDEEERKAETVDLTKVEYILKDIQRELGAQETLIKEKEQQVLFERERLHEALERDEQRRLKKMEAKKDVKVFVEMEERALDGQRLPPPQSLWSAPKVEKVKQEKLVFEYGNKSMLNPPGTGEAEPNRRGHVSPVAIVGSSSASVRVHDYAAHSVVNRQKEQPVDQDVSVEYNKDLRQELDKERLLKKLQPELEGVDPGLRARILRAILTTVEPSDSAGNRNLASPSEGNEQASYSSDNIDAMARRARDKGDKVRVPTQSDVTSKQSGGKSEVDDDMFDSLVFARVDESGLSSRPPIDVGISSKSSEGNLHSQQHGRPLEGHSRSFTKSDSASRSRKRRSDEKDRSSRRRERSRSREDRHRNRRKRSRSGSREGRRSRTGKKRRSRRSRDSSRSSESTGNDSNVDSSKDSAVRSKRKGRSQSGILQGSAVSKEDHALLVGGQYGATSISRGMASQGKGYFAAQSLAQSGFNPTSYRFGVATQSQLPGLTPPVLSEGSPQSLTAPAVFPPYSGWNQMNPLTTDIAPSPFDTGTRLPERSPGASVYSSMLGLGASVYPEHAHPASNQPSVSRPVVPHPMMTGGILPNQPRFLQHLSMIPPPPIPLPSSLSAKFESTLQNLEKRPNVETSLFTGNPLQASRFYQEETESTSINPLAMTSKDSLRTDQFEVIEQKKSYSVVHQSHLRNVLGSSKSIDDPNYGPLKDEKTASEGSKDYVPISKYRPINTREGTLLTSKETGALRKADSFEVAFGHTEEKYAEFVRTPEGFEPSLLKKPALYSLEPGISGPKAAALDGKHISLPARNSNSEERSEDMKSVLKLWHDLDPNSQLSHDSKGRVKKSILKQPTRQFKERTEEFGDPEDDPKSASRGQIDSIERLGGETPSSGQQQSHQGDRDDGPNMSQDGLFLWARGEEGLRKQEGEEIPLLQMGDSPSVALWTSFEGEPTEQKKEEPTGRRDSGGNFGDVLQSGEDKLRRPFRLDSSLHRRMEEKDFSEQGKDEMWVQDTYSGFSRTEAPYEVVHDTNDIRFSNAFRSFDDMPQQMSEGGQGMEYAEVPPHHGRPVVEHGDPSRFTAERRNDARGGDHGIDAQPGGMKNSGRFRKHYPNWDHKSQPPRQGHLVKGSKDVRSSTEGRTFNTSFQGTRVFQSRHEITRSVPSKLPFLCLRCQLTFESEKALEFHHCEPSNGEAKNDVRESAVDFPLNPPDYGNVPNSDKMAKGKGQTLADVSQFGDNMNEADTPPPAARRTGEPRYSGTKEAHPFESGNVQHSDKNFSARGEHFPARQSSGMQGMRGRQSGPGRIALTHGRGRGRGVPVGPAGDQKRGSYPDNSRRGEPNLSDRRTSDEQHQYRGGMPVRLRGLMRMLSHRGRPFLHARGRAQSR